MKTDSVVFNIMFIDVFLLCFFLKYHTCITISFGYMFCRKINIIMNVNEKHCFLICDTLSEKKLNVIDLQLWLKIYFNL